MDDYTPDTQEVEDYATEVNGAYALTREDFDRWLNEELAKAWDEGQLNGEFYLNPYRKAD